MSAMNLITKGSNNAEHLDLASIKHAHLIGVGGVGVSAIGAMLLERGVTLSGSDAHLPAQASLPKGSYSEGHREENVPSETDLIVYSDAVPETNPERAYGHAKKIPGRSFAQMLGIMTQGRDVIAVSGTHGKSTTTALLANLFVRGGLDPSAFVGAEVKEWGSNYHSGKSGTVIVEADEYREHMMELTPKTIVLTNLELDHPDYYRDLDHLKQVFTAYVAKLDEDGILVANASDRNVMEIAKSAVGRVVTFGLDTQADLMIDRIAQTGETQQFRLTWKGTDLGTFTTLLPGEYNLFNILAASACFLMHGGTSETIRTVLLDFNGVGRRFEILGEKDGVTIISDYAHHPTALLGVVRATRKRFPGKRLTVIYRPHHQERTKRLFSDYVRVLYDIDDLILVEIYDVAGRDSDNPISAQLLLETIAKEHGSPHGVFAKDLAEAEAIARSKFGSTDIMLVVGAGDADQLARRLLS